MRDENMRDLTPADLVIDELNLSTLAAIHEVVIAVDRYHLAGRVTVECRNCRIITEDCNSEHERLVCLTKLRLYVEEFSCVGVEVGKWVVRKPD
jgi:hypothetical protein